MANLMTVNSQWSSRPDDERFVGLLPLREQMRRWKEQSRGMVLATRAIMATPQGDPDHKGLVLRVNPGRERRGLDQFVLPGSVDVVAAPTHWAFGQLAHRAGAPAGYLRTLPSEMAADCINYGLMTRNVDEVGVLVRANGNLTASAVTGPNYGRVYNSNVVDALVDRFGDGLTGQFKVPGVFGKPVPVTKENTTIYASEQDMFVFLADEVNRIVVPNRRNGESGSLARGFFVWNSEVGAQTLGIALFLYDYVCGNRIVWGAEQFKEIRIRHTSSAPARLIEEVRPALMAYAESSAAPVEAAIAAARGEKIAGSRSSSDERREKLSKFLAQRFSGKRLTQSQIAGAQSAHEEEEGRPIETVWDAVVGLTAYAKNIPWQDERVEVERVAGKILDTVA